MYTADGLIETLRKKGEALVIPKFRRDVRKMLEFHRGRIELESEEAPCWKTSSRYVLEYLEVGRTLNSLQWGHLGASLANLEMHFDGLKEVFEGHGGNAFGKAIVIDVREPMTYCTLGKLAYDHAMKLFEREEILMLFDRALGYARVGSETWGNIFDEYRIVRENIPVEQRRNRQNLFK